MSGTRGLRRPAPVLAALLLSACTFGSASPAPSTSDTPASGSPSAAASSGGPSGGSPSASGAGTATASPGATASPAPPRPPRRLRLTGTVRIPLRGQTYGRGLVLWGRYAAWVGCNGCQREFTEPTTLYVADLRTRAVRAVTTAPRGGSVVPVGGSGSVLVYGVATPRGTATQWTLQTQDLAGTARTVLVRASRANAGGPPLVAVVGAGQVAWQTISPQPPGGVRGPVTAVDLTTGVRRTLSPDLPGLLSGVTPAGVVFRGAQSAGNARGGVDDAMLLRPGRSEPVVLSVTHDVRDLVADERTVVWQTADGPGAAVWAAPLDGRGAARQYYRGGTGDRAVGSGFLAVVTTGDFPVLLMYPLAGGPMAAVGDIPGEFDALAAEGSRLAYLALPGERGVQPDARRPIVLVVGTVQLPAR